MLKLKYCILAILFCIPAIAKAQVGIKGLIIEKSTQQPVEQASIRLLAVKDSAFIDGTTANQDGKFSIPSVKAGNYLLSVSFIGLTTYYKSIKISDKPLDVGTISLDEDDILLKEAVVTAKAIEMQVNNDTVEYNANAFVVAEGSMLEDLLKKMPGVEIDSEGKVTVNGKEIKKIMVDGKEFFSDDPKVAAKNLPAKMIDKVQVYDKKSDMATMTGFDDGEEEPVINLAVKPNMKQGWFGNAFAGYGNKDRYEGNFMINRFINNDQFTIMGGMNNTNNMGFSDISSSMFSGMGGGRRGSRGGGSGNGITKSGNLGINFNKTFNPKLILGGNVNYSHSNNDSRVKSETQNILPGDSSSYDYEQSQSSTISDNVSANFRLEWKPDTMTQLIFRPNVTYSKTKGDEFANSVTLNNLMDTVNTSRSNSPSNGEGGTVSANLDFSRKLNSEGRVFSASMSGGYNDSYNKGFNISEVNYLQATQPNDLIDQKFKYDNNGYNYRVFVSWVEPLGRNNFLQLNYRFSQNERESLKHSYNNDSTGYYTELDTAYSKSTRNNAIEQRVGLNFKAVRAKYNYSIGVNMDPSNTRTKTFVGDQTISLLKRNVVNLSPMAQLNYMFDKRMNLRIDYDGKTSQPSMSQLQPVADISNPLITTIGNPDLKPTYTNSMRIRFQKFVPEKQTAFIVGFNGSYVLNDIVSKTAYDGSTGKRITTYENVNGNFRTDMRVLLNTPLKNKNFTINTMTFGVYSNANGFINDEKNKSKNLTLNERAGINFRNSKVNIGFMTLDNVEFGLNGNFRFNQTKNSLQQQDNIETYNYGGGANMQIDFPGNFQLASDITYSTNSGYSSGYQQEEVLWNASASKSFLKGNAGTLRFKIYDILQKRSNISQSVSANTISYSEYNTLTSYFMVHFIYKFSIFGGGASENDMKRGGGRGPRGDGGPPPRF